MAVQSEYVRSYHLPVLFAKQNDRQSEEINVTDEPQVENRPVPVQEAEIRWTKSFLGRPLCLLCLAAAQKITHAAHSLSRLGELYVKAGYICFNPSSRVARLGGAPSAPCIQALRFLSVFIEILTMPLQEPPKKKSKQVGNKQGTLLSWVKPCTSDPEPGVLEETIRIKKQPGNKNDLEPSTTTAGRQQATKRLSPPD